jgi:hypothetical protein
MRRSNPKNYDDRIEKDLVKLFNIASIQGRGFPNNNPFRPGAARVCCVSVDPVRVGIARLGIADDVGDFACVPV